MKYCVVGAGGVGGYFGGKLAMSGPEVWFLARGEHLQAMRRAGLRVNASDERFVVPPGRMTDAPEEIGVCDVVLFCVKCYDTVPAARMIPPLADDSTVIISLQNGIDNEVQIGEVVRRGAVYGGIAYVYATITAPGEISETGGPKKLVFGPLDTGHVDPRGSAILAGMQAAGIPATLSDDIRTDLWKKFIFISAVGPVTALTRLTLGEILAVDETRTLLEEAMHEAAAVARAAGIVLGASLVPGMFDTLRRFDNRSRSSMYNDLATGKPLEIEAFSGTIVRLGQERGVPTPVHRMLYAALLPHHRSRQRPSPHHPPERNPV
jgi:2-dehydropantoate 2-reductase